MLRIEKCGAFFIMAYIQGKRPVNTPSEFQN